MKKALLVTFTLFIIVSLFGCASSSKNSPEEEKQNKENSQQNIESDKEIVKQLIKGFGSKLQNVPLQAQKDVLNKSIEENYADFVSPTLLEEWMKNPQKAPGRITSSPWPDRIEILSIEESAKNVFKVKGNIIEITSVEKVNGGIAGKRPISLMVEKINNRWLITKVTLQSSDESNSIDYENTQYGFNFHLPSSWKGYKILTETWEGMGIEGQQSGKIVEKGPLITIRHPQWTTQNPRQDIPILVFTLSQWNSLQQEDFHIGAAPVGPSELGRNTSYVFALPARYNYAFPTGYEEVEEILQNKPLHAF